MPENIPLKRFNYKIWRQISCPYGGGLLISQWSRVKQLTFDTVYIFSNETRMWCIVSYSYCIFLWFLEKEVVKRKQAWNEKYTEWGHNLSTREKHLHWWFLKNAGPCQPSQSGGIPNKTYLSKPFSSGLKGNVIEGKMKSVCSTESPGQE